MNLTFSGLLLYLGALQALLLAVFLFSRRPPSQANRYLGALVLLLGLGCFFQAQQRVGFYVDFPHLMRLDWGLPLLFGPLLYGYVTTLARPRTRFRWNELWHTGPYAVHLTIMLPFLIQDAETKRQALNYFTAMVTTGIDGYAAYFMTLQALEGIVGLAYTAAALREVAWLRRSLQEHYSDLEQFKLGWLGQVVGGMGVLWIVFLLSLGLARIEVYPVSNYMVYFFLAAFVAVYLLSYRALARPQVLTWTDPTPSSPQQASSEEEVALGIMATRLQTLMDEEKLYRESDLTSQALADRLGWTRHQLSKVLNQALGLNFYEFINGYRVEAVKARLADPGASHLTLLGLAYEAGFNSKTTFNTFFKKTTGMTPSQYKKHLAGRSEG